jgi:transcriptional antiterminator RfaH
MRAWYAVYTQPGKEALASQNLRQQGFEVYLPRYSKKRSHARRVEWIAAPLFPRYLFVAMDVEATRWRAIHSTIGVLHLVCFGESPMEVPSYVVESLMARQDEKELIIFAPTARLAKGDKVRFLDGAFSESIGVIEYLDDQDRVTMLLDLMGRQVKIQAPLQTVAAIG